MRAVSPRFTFAVVALSALTLSVLSPKIVPYDMDEFAAYHPLGCAAYPLSRAENHYRERCGEYDLTLPLFDSSLPLRSYLYIGSLPVVPYWAFWRLIQDPVSARVQGAIFWLIGLLLLGRLVGIGPGGALFAATLFPVLPAAFLVDTGPVGLSILLLLGSLLVMRRALLEAGPQNVLQGALVGLLLFLGVFVKLVFFFCLPGVGLLFLVWGRRGGWKPAGQLAAGAACVFVPLTLSLLLARTVDGARYIDVVRRANLVVDPAEAGGVAQSLVSYVLRASALLPRIFTFSPSLLDYLPALTGLGMLAASASDREVRAYAGAAVLTFVATDVSTRAFEAHHAVFFIAFLVLALAHAVSRTPKAGLLVAIIGSILVWASLGARLSAAEVDPRRNFEKDALLRDIRKEGLDEKTLVLHGSWGTYYIAHLFGGAQQAQLFSKKFLENPVLLGEVKSRAETLGRGILLITRKADRLEAPDAVLGARLRVIEEGNWLAVEYLR